MTSFSYNTNVPNPPNNPSVDVTDMQSNTLAISQILAVDHVTFNSTGPANSSGGQHLRVAFNGKNAPVGTPTDPLSIMYTNNVVAVPGQNTASASTVSEIFYQNSNATFPVSMIKAFGCFDSGANSLNTWNMAASRTSAGIFVITMPSNVVASTSYLVIISSTLGAGSTQLNISYVINSATQFTINVFRAGSVVQVDPSQFSVIVMQL